MRESRLYTEEHRMFYETVRRFAEAEIHPYEDEWREAGIVPRELFRKAGAVGLLCPQVPEAYGGLALDYRYNAIMTEALHSPCALGFGLQSDIICPYIVHYGSEQQKRQWLPKMVSGEVITAIAMTEPNTGSDLQAVATTAIRDGDEYVVNGSKTFVSNGQNADLVVVVCKTDPHEGARGVSLMLVEASRPGFKRGRNLKKLGLKEQDTSELFFEDVRVPATNLLGAEGGGFFSLMSELPQERLCVSIGSVVAAQGAFDLTLAYVKERKAFGRRILDFQNTRFKLAEMSAQLAAAWAYMDHCIELHIQGQLDAVKAAQFKLWATEMFGRVADECVQLHGGYGYMDEYKICRLYGDARVQRIYGGTSEIMKELIGRTLG